MSKYLPIFTLLLAHCLSPSEVLADLIRLKGANGQIVSFNIQSVQSDGIMAQREGAYKYVLIQWEHLDLEWLQENQADIWQEKLDIDAAKKIAFEGFKFGQTRDEVHRQINAMEAQGISPDCFNETDPRAIWVIFDPSTLRRFGRFVFADERLVEIEIHINFNEDEDISQSMKSEWENLQNLVAHYRLEPQESHYFPRASDWHRWKNQADQDKDKLLVTHRWGDETRSAELGLQFQKFDLGPAKSPTKPRITMFGATASTVMLRTDSNWVVYKAKLSKPTP